MILAFYYLMIIKDMYRTIFWRGRCFVPLDYFSLIWKVTMTGAGLYYLTLKTFDPAPPSPFLFYFYKYKVIVTILLRFSKSLIVNFFIVCYNFKSRKNESFGAER